MSAETIAIQSASVSIDAGSAREILRTLIPIGRQFAQITRNRTDDLIVDGLEAFVESDRLWSFFAQLLSGEESDGPRSLMGDQRFRMAATEAGVKPEEFVEYLPLILSLAKALLSFWQSRRGG